MESPTTWTLLNLTEQHSANKIAISEFLQILTWRKKADRLGMNLPMRFSLIIHFAGSKSQISYKIL
jgi:hypothetical protein